MSFGYVLFRPLCGFCVFDCGLFIFKILYHFTSPWRVVERIPYIYNRIISFQRLMRHPFLIVQSCKYFPNTCRADPTSCMLFSQLLNAKAILSLPTSSSVIITRNLEYLIVVATWVSIISHFVVRYKYPGQSYCRSYIPRPRSPVYKFYPSAMPTFQNSQNKHSLFISERYTSPIRIPNKIEAKERARSTIWQGPRRSNLELS